MRVAALVAMLVMTSIEASRAHDRWSNGEAVPHWVKEICCGRNEIHHIPATAVRLMADGYHIEGIQTVVPEKRAIPSPDGTFWGFWNEPNEPDPTIYCFFAPLPGS
jgi:hypothetical protein